MTTPQQQILDKCKAVFANATALFGSDMSQVSIRFDLKGRAAGMACRRGAQYYMRFNRDMLTREAFDHVLNNTVPHEIAHIVCMMNPRFGSGHNSGWARVCAQLGGNAQRCHKEDVVYGKGATYEYTTAAGHTHRFSQVIHGKIQAGLATYNLRGGKGKIDRTCVYAIVGHQGRTLANPIPKAPVVRASTEDIVVNPAMQQILDRVSVVAAPPRVIDPQVTAARGSYIIGVAAPRTPTIAMPAGASKASIARAIMLAGHNRGMSYEDIITAIMAATGHERQLARATYKANAPKVGIPVQ